MIIWAAVGIVAGIYIFFRGFVMLQRKRLILDTPSSKIRSASMGLVELSGLATGPYTMTAPLCGLPCYYFRTLAWQWKQAGKNKQWVKIVDESLHLPFYLDDNTGRVLVNPQGAELDIHRDFHEEYSPSLFSTHDFMPPSVSTLLARHGVDAYNQKFKVEEYCIKPKNALFIMGNLAENPGLEVAPRPIPTDSSKTLTIAVPGFNPMRWLSDGILGSSQTTGASGKSTTISLSLKSPYVPNPAPEVIHLTSDTSPPLTSHDMTQQQKVAAALIKAGITNPAAWEAAGLPQAGAVAVAEAKPDQAEAFDLHPQVVLMKGEHSPAFFISWRSQKDVVASLGWKSALFIWGGPVLSLVCVYVLAVHFHVF